MVIDAKWPRKEFTAEEELFCSCLTDDAGLLLDRDRLQRELDEKLNIIEFAEAADEAAHRFRNSLQAIGGFARRLIKLDAAGFVEKGKGYCGEIVKGIDSLEKLVGELVKFQQPRRTKMQEIDLNEVIEGEVGKSVSELERNKNIKFYVKLDPEPTVILGDPLDISEIFYPIFKNAIEAIKKEGRIYVKSRQENGWARISVSNTGGCVDEEIIHEIFNPFFTTKPGAAGMGLATVRKIINDYEGKIKVENDKSSNTATFIVRLPVYQQRKEV
jgi:signal transduction histidine kinase